MTAGTAEAGSPADARSILRDQGLVAYDVREMVTKKRGKVSGDISWLNLSGRRLDLLTQTTRHLALLLRAGVPLGQALSVLVQQIEDRRFRDVIVEVAARVQEGTDIDA